MSQQKNGKHQWKSVSLGNGQAMKQCIHCSLVHFTGVPNRIYEWYQYGRVYHKKPHCPSRKQKVF